VNPWREAIWQAVPAGARPERFEERRAFLLDAVRPGDRVLDLGVGDGAFATALLNGGAAVSGVDVAEEALRRARAQAPAADLRLVAEGEPLPFAEDAFDVVWAGDVLEHVADVVGLLADVRRVLRWGGTLLVTTPRLDRLALLAMALGPARWTGAWFDPRADHLRFFSTRALRTLLSDAGFAEVRVARGGGRAPLSRALHVRAS
jgi:2-polyprenyl-3-methyl-5-hydroxy-6-metoxy-1,4-benzoquinol methylase